MDPTELQDKLSSDDLEAVLQTLLELKDRISDPLTASLLDILLPALDKLLTTKTTPNSHPKLRKAVLDVCTRLIQPQNEELLKVYSLHLLQMAMAVVLNDYEDNAMAASRIVFDLHHKNYRPELQEQVQPFLDFVLTAYRQLPKSVEEQFAMINTNASAGSTSASTTEPSTIVQSPALSRSLESSSVLSQVGEVDSPQKQQDDNQIKSASSFKVLTECPLTVMLLFQLYPKFIKPNIENLISLMMEALAIRPPVVPESMTASQQLARVSRMRELIACQVKTLSFFTYLIKGFSEQMKRYDERIEERIASNIVALMSLCPADAVSTRKELLVATRRILATDFRRGFYPQLDSLFDERVLMGPNRQNDTLRPMGYSTLADLVHHVRPKLSLAQMGRVVYIFSKVIHDPSLPLSIQTTSVRLLLNLVDYIYRNKDPNPTPGRELLVCILSNLVRKLGTLRKSIDLIRSSEQERKHDEEIIENLCTAEFNTFDSEFGFVERELNRTYSFGGPCPSFNSIRDVKTLLKPMIIGLKTVIWFIKSYNDFREREQAKSKGVKVSLPSVDGRQLSNFERNLITKYLKWGIPCLEVFKLNLTKEEEISALVEPKKTQFREMLDHFSAAFNVLDRFNTQRTIGAKMSFIFDQIIDDPELFALPQHWLVSNKSISLNLSEVLMGFLVERLDGLSEVDATVYMARMGSTSLDALFYGNKVPMQARESYTLLRLFKVLFQAISLYHENESVLRCYLQTLIASCLRRTSAGKAPANYFYLLIRLFRAISGGKFEKSYKEILPLVPTIMGCLNNIYLSTDDEALRNSIVETCLTVPARLSSLLPHLPQLLRMMVSSLRATSGDLVNLGLRTMEFWVDNLHPDFLYPIFNQESHILREIMVSLTNHLQPAPYPYGLLALRLLGKLGGRNRQFLVEPMPLDITSSKQNEFGNDGMKLQIECEWNVSHDVDKMSDECTKFNDILQINLSLKSAVGILKRVALSPRVCAAPKHDVSSSDFDSEYVAPSLECPKSWEEIKGSEMEFVDFTAHSVGLMECIKKEQQCAAFNVLKGILSCSLQVSKSDDLSVVVKTEELHEIEKDTSNISDKGSFINLVCKGLLYASSDEELHDEATVLLKGLGVRLLLLIANTSNNIDRVDECGNKLPFESKLEAKCEDSDGNKEKGCQDIESKHSSSSSNMLPPLKSFGFYQLPQSIRFMNPLTYVEVICDFLNDAGSEGKEVAIDLIRYILEQSKVIEDTVKEEVNDAYPVLLIHHTVRELFLSTLCQHCYSKTWSSKSAAFEGILTVICSTDKTSGMEFIQDVLHAGLFALKDSPREVASKGVDEAISFLCKVLFFFFGTEKLTSISICDVSTVPDEFESPSLKAKFPTQNLEDLNENEGSDPSECVVAVSHVFISELASTKHSVRFASRYFLRYISIVTGISLTKLFKSGNNYQTLKQVLALRVLLRSLPVAEQVGIIEALAFVMEKSTLLELNDQHVLTHISELLKMVSQVDGDSSDTSGTIAVDDNGSTVNTSFGCKSSSTLSSGHAASIFLHDKRDLSVSGVTLNIPAEYPYYVQLRVSSLLLFRTIIRRHTKLFFSAESTSNIGTIRPYVINLLFRSLIAYHPRTVTAAFATLHHTLSLAHNEDMKEVPQLDKTLLQNCIRPILLNLRDYTKLSVPLLNGMARLLSLLSSWFNATLGGKLLEHLKKWEDPDLIRSSHIWRVGEEPNVAAAIIGLFEFLPRTTDFVEPLIKATLSLENVLPRYKEFCSVTSPFRQPLVRYLNKYPDITLAFFINEKRLGKEIYSSLLLDIIQIKEANILRKSLTVNIVKSLSKCFERPLEIIHSERNAPKDQKKSTSEILIMHGIPTPAALSAATAQDQKETMLRRDIEVKEGEVQVAQQAEKKAKSLLQSTVQANKGSSGPSDQQPEVVEAKNQHQIANSAYEDARKNLSEAKKKYTDAVNARKSTIEMSVSLESSSDKLANPMTNDALEWMHQGLKIVEVLIKTDPNFFEDGQKDLILRYRLLCRSMGRYLRQFHEENINFRYRLESKLIVKVLMVYVRQHPEEVDILFDLLRVFLVKTSTDYFFVKKFLEDMVTNVLSLGHKKVVLQRFFTILSSEGSGEAKVHAVQYLVFPLIKAHLEKERKAGILLKKTPDSMDIDDKNSQKGDETSRSDLIDLGFIQKFIDEILLKVGYGTSRSDKLHVELLKLSTLLIDFMGEELTDRKKDLIKYTWNHLKNDSLSSKYWAYVNVCKFIATFETPSRVVLQVYVALLRTHTADKELVRTALDVLVPSIPRRPDDFQKAMKYTQKVLFEEGHSLPQLTHMWQIVVRNPTLFYAHRSKFTSHMINSLGRMGLPANSTNENRCLSLSIMNVILKWEKMRLRTEGKVQIEPAAKKQKMAPSTVVSTEEKDVEKYAVPKSMIELAMNFLVRAAFISCESKDHETLALSSRAVELFREACTIWTPQTIRTSSFENLFSRLKKDFESVVASEKRYDKKKAGNKVQKSGVKHGQSSSSSNDEKDSHNVSNLSLCTCLDICSILLPLPTQTNFFVENTSHLKNLVIVGLSRAMQTEAGTLRSKMGHFLLCLFSTGRNFHDKVRELLQLSITSMERAFLSSNDISNSTSAISKSESKKSRQEEEHDPFEVGRTGGKCSSFFIVSAIEKIVKGGNTQILSSFTGALLHLATRLMKNHAKLAAVNTRNMAVMMSQVIGSGVQQPLATPTVGILEEGCGPFHNLGNSDPVIKEASEPGSAIRTMIVCVRLIGESQVPYSFSEIRRKYLQLLFSIIEKSDNVPLLLTVMGVVGNWSNSKRSPLTKEERSVFMSKMVSFNRLPDIQAQPLNDVVARMVLSINESKNNLPTSVKRKFFLGKRKSFSFYASEQHKPTSPTSTAVEVGSHGKMTEVEGRVMVANMLSANSSIRMEMFKMFLTNIFGSEDASLGAVPLDKLLMAVLSCDYEGLGERLWIPIIVESLLRISTTDESLSLIDENNEKICLPDPTPNTPSKIKNKSSSSFQGTKLYDDYLKFAKIVHVQKSEGCENVLTCLSTLVHNDGTLCIDLLNTLLKSVSHGLITKGTLGKSTFDALLEELSLRPYHSQFIYYSRFPTKSLYPRPTGPNVVQVMLRASLQIEPLPIFDVKAIYFLSTNYNAYHEGVKILEAYAEMEEQKLDKSMVIHLLRKLYEKLGEHSLNIVHAKRTTSIPAVKQTMALDIYEEVESALSSYNSLISSFDENQNDAVNNNFNDLSLWEDRWVELNRESAQWAVLSDYAKSSNNPKLLMECAWKARDWDAVRSLFLCPSIVAALEAGDPDHKIFEIYLSIADGKLNEVEKLHAQAVQLCLHQWQLLPGIVSGSNTHMKMLQTFNRLVELRESGQVMLETSNHSSNQTTPDFKNVLTTWRERLPNVTDKFSVWDDLLTWRLHIFTSIAFSFKFADANALALLHDKPWTMIRSAQAARKLKMTDLALRTLNKVASNAMDVSDAFMKLREQVLACKDLKTENDLRNGLNIVNTTNLGFFVEKQKSELFRIKAEFLEGLRNKQTNKSFSESVQVCPEYGKPWLSWGEYLVSLAEITDRGSSTDKTKVVQYLVQAMGCYLESIRCGHVAARTKLADCLWMTRRDEDKSGTLSETLEKRGTLIPSWLWIPWIPQLLTGLGRAEVNAAKVILSNIATRYPQALYYNLRAFYLERRDLERSRGSSSSTTNDKRDDSTSPKKDQDGSKDDKSPAKKETPPRVSAAHVAEELMSSLRRSHQTLCISLESILEELIIRFRSSYEEDLLATINSLLQRAEDGMLNSKDSGNEEAMLASFERNLKKVSAKYFRPVPSSVENADIRVRKANEFRTLYKDEFEKDFNVNVVHDKTDGKDGKDEKTLTVSIMIDRLRKWHNILSRKTQNMPRKVPLNQLSPSLSCYRNTSPVMTFRLSKRTDVSKSEKSSVASLENAAQSACNTAHYYSHLAEGCTQKHLSDSKTLNLCTFLDIPGSYLAHSDTKPTPELNPKIVKFEDFVEITLSDDVIRTRKIGILGSNGRSYYFVLHFAFPYLTRTEERSYRFTDLLQKTVSKFNDVKVASSIVIPVAQRLRMAAESSTSVSLDNIRVISKKDKDSPKADEILLHHVERISNSIESFFIIRKILTQQMAANSLVQYALCSQERIPSKVVFDELTGQISSPEFQLNYNNRGLLETPSDKVPFRLTPNLVKLIGPILYESVFIPTLAKYAHELGENKNILSNYALCLLLRDDIISWYSSRSNSSASNNKAADWELEKQLEQRVPRNTELFYTRLKQCSYKVVNTKKLDDPAAEETQEENECDADARALADSAKNPDKLSKMNPQFMSWL